MNHDQLKRRLARLPHHLRHHFEHHFALLADSELRNNTDTALAELLDYQLTTIEAELFTQPFHTPTRPQTLTTGTIHTVTTPDEHPVRITLEPGPNRVTHALITGQSYTGKTTLSARIATNAARAGYHTLVIDPTRSYRHVTELANTHHVLKASDLRLNPYDAHPGVPTRASDQAVTNEIAEAYGLQFGALELATVTEEARQQGHTPNLPDTIRRLTAKTYKGFSKRGTYRDSALIILQDILRSTGPLYECTTGMNTQHLLAKNLVLELDLTAKHQAFLIRHLILTLELTHQSTQPLTKPLALFLDEAQLLTAQRNFYERVARLRHANIHLVANMQNAHLAPPQLLGNADAHYAFRSTDQRDRHTIARALNLNTEQAEHLATLPQKHCITLLQNTTTQHAFLAHVPDTKHTTLTNDQLQRRTHAFLTKHTWTPYTDTRKPQDQTNTHQNTNQQPPQTTQRILTPEERLLQHVLNQNNEHQPLTTRYEATGIRSATTQQSTLKKLLQKNLITTHTLQTGPGRPITLLQPTQKALTQHNHTWKNTRGHITTRAATTLLHQKLKTQPGTTIREANYHGKQVDLLHQHPNQTTTTIEIARTPKHENHNALHCTQQKNNHKHIIIALTKTTQKHIQQRLKQHPQLNTNKIHTTTLAHALNPKWTP